MTGLFRPAKAQGDQPPPQTPCPEQVTDESLDLLITQLSRRLDAEWASLDRLQGRLSAILSILAAVPTGLSLGAVLTGAKLQPALEVTSITLMFAAAAIAVVYLFASPYDYPPGARSIYQASGWPSRDIKWGLIGSFVNASERNMDRLTTMGQVVNLALGTFFVGAVLFALSRLFS